jgi:uncharacterized protein YdbL (DUF1318 family)
MTMRLGLVGLGVAIALGTVATQGSAQSSADLAAARRAGQVGERFDGYMGYASTPSTVVQRQVAAVNIRRRSLYSGLAVRRGATTQAAGIATGCELLAGLAVGEAYMLPDGVWRRRRAGQPAPQPDYCR